MRIRTFILVGVMLSGCFSVDAIVYSPYDTQPLPPKAEGAPIETFREYPPRSYVEIAQIEVRPAYAAFSIAKATRKIKEKARELGADAVIGLNVFVAPPGTVGAGQVKGSGVAVKWK